jgi:uncharacterized protein (TIGR03437 family)
LQSASSPLKIETVGGGFMMRILTLLICAASSSLLLAQTPGISQGGILNGASFAVGQPVTRGSLVSIFGTDLAGGLTQASSIPLSTSLAGVSVSFNGIPAPLLFVSPTQINAQLPWEVLGGGASSGTATVVVRRGDAMSAPRDFQIGPFSPGIFSVQFGVGTAIAVNPDGSVAAPENSIPGLRTQPAKIGDTIILYATGLGVTDPPGRTADNSLDALRRTTTIPTVLIGGREAQASFSGLSPQFVGVNQMNVVVPTGVTPGVVPIQLRVGGITSTDQVTIAVRAP